MNERDLPASRRLRAPRRLKCGLTLLYEDRDLIVVDKPAGLLSIAAGRERERTAHWILSEYLRAKGEKRRAAAVHRLDRGTSGVMLFAKSEWAKRALMNNWNEAVAERRYVALAEGVFAEPEGTIDAPLGEDGGGRVIVMPGGKPALTRWKALPLAGFGRRLNPCAGGYTLLSLELETGRRNQIRAHLAWAGHPVAGDAKYGARSDPLRRLCLHAESLAFRHPADGRLMRFEVPALPELRGQRTGQRLYLGQNRDADKGISEAAIRV